jgi:colanic acid/amylovoran biosynthesis glycosyltransferase
MRVCYVLNQFPELSQTFVLRQIVDLLRRGHDVEVIAARVGNEFAEEAALWSALDRSVLEQRTLYTGMPNGLPSRALRGLRLGLRNVLRAPRLVMTAIDVRRFGWFAATGSLLAMGIPLAGERRAYDAIVAHFGPQGMLAQGLREMGVIAGPLVTFFHAYDLTSAPRRVGRRMYQRLFERGELQLAISRRGEELLHRLGAPPGRVKVHHMGVDVDVFRPPQPHQPSAGDRVWKVASIGRLVAKKGFDFGLRAIAKARDRGISIEYSIFGAGPLEGELRHLIDELGLRGAARLEGPASHARLVESLKATNALLAPSVTSKDGDEEGIPMVLMEAMASGVPVVASQTGGVAELIDPEQSGLLVPERDVDGLCDALCRLVATPALARRLADAGRERVTLEFNEAEQGRRLVEILGSLGAGV